MFLPHNVQLLISRRLIECLSFWGVSIIDANNAVAPPRFEDAFPLSKELLLLLEFFVLFQIFLQLFDFIPLVEWRPERLLLSLVEGGSE